MGNCCKRKRVTELDRSWEPCRSTASLINDGRSQTELKLPMPRQANCSAGCWNWCICFVGRRATATISEEPDAQPASAKPLEVVPYHKFSHLQNTPGYCGNLTQSQEVDLCRLRKTVLEHLGSLTPWLLHGETEDRLLLRFLRARNFNTRKAFTALVKDIQWRRAVLVQQGLGTIEAPDVLKDSWETLCQCLSFRHVGHDIQGRPIILKNMDARSYEYFQSAPVSVAQLVQYHIWQMESFCRLLSAQSQRLNACIEQLVFVFDAEGWYPTLVTRRTLAHAMAMAKIDSEHYPERLGCVVLINSPRALVGFWNFFRRFVPERTQEKFSFCATRSDAFECLFPLVEDSEFLTELLGHGSA